MIWGMIFHKNLNEWVIIGNYFWIRSLTKQIKRTRLRLVAYIQVLSRVAYLPNRYAITKQFRCMDTVNPLN